MAVEHIALVVISSNEASPANYNGDAKISFRNRVNRSVTGIPKFSSKTCQAKMRIQFDDN